MGVATITTAFLNRMKIEDADLMGTEIREKSPELVSRMMRIGNPAIWVSKPTGLLRLVCWKDHYMISGIFQIAMNSIRIVFSI